MSDYSKSTALLQILEEDFGANSSYVESMLDRYIDSPSLVDETWKQYFSELLMRVPNGVTGAKFETNGHTVQQTANGAMNGTAQPKAETTVVVREEKKTPPPITGDFEINTIAGGGKKIVENMELSLTVPTATSLRYVPVKLLEENRRIINKFLEEQHEGKVSFTHLIGWAFVRALQAQPGLNDGFTVKDSSPARVKRPDVNLGIAIDMQKRDGSRSLLVPNVKKANTMTFKQFLKTYDDIVKRARANKLDISDFEGTTVSLTNPGTIGTVASVPRLMSGQAIILATGSIEYPAEYQAMDQEVLTQLGVSKVIQLTSTYDHRIIQGAESGLLLQYIHELLTGKHDFYDRIFLDLGIAYRPLQWSSDRNPGLFGMDQTRQQMAKQAGVLQLINAYRLRGHLIADIDPLHAIPVHWHPELEIETYGLSIWDLDREFMTEGLGRERMKLRDIVDHLRASYCGSFGIEFRHLQVREEMEWLRERLESAPAPIALEVRKRLLWKLISAEQFEQFIHKNFIGQKRFSVEGSETVIAILDQLIEGAAARGVKDIYFGMAHRGRLNVLCNVLGHFCERIFTAFAGSVHPSFPADEGDVKYHQGAKSERETQGQKVNLTLSPNPSHLEFVDAVVEGMARAKQDALQASLEEKWSQVMPVLIHGDAAFAGQGIVMETLNLETLKGYGVGGTIHIIVNNQIGFTTSPEAGRSTIYSTDVARMTGVPIFHVNADDPDAAYRVLQLALDYRQTFHKDIVIDVVGFRRLGHNESDEPSYTQPLMYARVKAHKGVRSIYAQKLIRDGVYSEEEVNNLIQDRNNRYTDALNRAKAIVEKKSEKVSLPPTIEEIDGSQLVDTGADLSTLQELTQLISIMPEGFHTNPKMVSQLARRAKMGEGSSPMDWAFGEAMAFGSLVKDGHLVRLSGQDSGRGTFSQRHAILYDIEDGKPWIPLSQVKSSINPDAQFYVYDSSLSEQGVMGFEYGYSVVAGKALVLWEAQFGDFANGAQVIIDQFIASGEDKWQQTSRLGLLLPHGYEGQGPEHSSARLERFLQLCAENNLTVVNATTPAQYFHLLRRQVMQDAARPFVLMTPKSLLRHPKATSDIHELTTGSFMPVLDDHLISDKSQVKRLVFSSGKVYYDLLEGRTEANANDVALIRLEQFYPFPERMIKEIAATYPNVKEIVWTQEEPMNMGGWTFVEPRLNKAIGNISPARFVGRQASASPATGFFTVHELEQKQIVKDSITL